MGIKVNEGGGKGVTFADMKGKPQEYLDAKGEKKWGSIVLSVGEKGNRSKQVLPSNSSISGFVTDLDVSEHVHDGETITSLKIKLEDDKGTEPPVILSVGLGSYFAAKIVGLLNAADLSKPLVVNANVVKAGEKFGNGVAERDNVFPTMRQGADLARLVEVWAGGMAKLPDAPKVKISGKEHTDMTPVNEVVAATLQEVMAKLDALRPSEAHSDDHDDGLSAADVAAAAQQAGGQPERARG